MDYAQRATHLVVAAGKETPRNTNVTISHPEHVCCCFYFFYFTLIKDHGALSLHDWTVLNSLQFIVRILQTTILAIADFPWDQLHKVL